MNTVVTKTSFDSNFAQIAWVVKDLAATQIFFIEAMGIGNFSQAEVIRLADGSTFRFNKLRIELFDF